MWGQALQIAGAKTFRLFSLKLRLGYAHWEMEVGSRRMRRIRVTWSEEGSEGMWRIK